MISFFEDIFKYEKFPTEFECLKQLEGSDLNYIGVPWTQILNSHWLQFPGNRGRDYYLKELSKYTVDTKDNFTVCQHDSYASLSEYFKHLNITKVFSTLHDTNVKLDGIDVIPISFAFGNTFDSDIDKDITISFVGSYTTHPIRQTIKDNIQGPYFIYRDQYHVGSDVFEEKVEVEAEYKDVLERSRFSLCPRGSSPSSVRFWESLSCGAIPVLVSDDWDLPEWDWDNTIIRLYESDIEAYNYDELCYKINSTSRHIECKLRSNCLKAYEKFKAGNFKQYIEDNI